MRIEELRAEDRVQLHPATDSWMRGDRCATVTKVGAKVVTVKTDSGRTLRVHPDNVFEVVR